MDWRPKVIWGDPEVTIEFDMPQRPWTPVPTAVGGRRVAASGAQAAYRVRHDEFVEKRIRFSEQEWLAVREWLVWAQGAGLFEWYDDQLDGTTVQLVYLHHPEMGQAIRPERSPEFPLVFELSITLRLALGVVSAREYFEPPSPMYAFLVDDDFYVIRSVGITGASSALFVALTTVQSGEFRVLQPDRTGDAFLRVGGFAVMET